jgi:hypothetical protein
MTTTERTAGPGTTPRAEEPDDAITLRRRTIDRILTGFGVVATLAFLVAGVLLLWGSNFSDDYVHDELSSQNITFPTEDELREEGRDDLVEFAGQDVTTGEQAEAYASYIDGHLQEVAGGQTYSQIDDRGAAAAVEEATEAGAPQAEIDELQATADQLAAQRNTLFKGETLRGLLLSAYAWATVGTIAGYAAYAAFAAAALMAILVVLGFVHLRRHEHA